jgi:hypothetical protein
MIEAKYPHQFGDDYQAEGIRAYLGENADEEQVSELLRELEAEVNARLPLGAFWTPSTSQFTYPETEEIPEVKDMADLFDEAWQAVEGRIASS